MRPLRATSSEIAALAGAQHGVVTRAQLRAIGMSDRAISRGAAGGRLHRLHRGVFAVGHTVLTVEGRWMAATLATGGALSHATAAGAWDLRRRMTGVIHLTVYGHGGRLRRDGLRIHRSTTLTAADITTYRAIPITTPARTIIDLATTLEGRPLEAALDRAEHLRLLDFADLRHRRIPRSLQAVLSHYTASNPTRSELEERFFELCDDHGIQRPEANVVIEGVEVDFVWRDRRLIVEVDGYAYHRSPTAFEADRERDVILALAGWQVRRFTWRQVTTRQAWVAGALDM